MQQRRHQGDSCMACDVYDSSGCCRLCRRNDILHSTRSHASNEHFIAGGSATATLLHSCCAISSSGAAAISPAAARPAQLLSSSNRGRRRRWRLTGGM